MDVNWLEKYNILKKNYDRVVQVRQTLVKKDIEDLKEKIREHERILQRDIDEINTHNRNLESIKDEVLYFKKEIPILKEKIDTLKREIIQKDSILGVLINYKRFNIRCFNHDAYVIRIDLLDEIKEFRIVKDKNTIIYKPTVGIGTEAPERIRNRQSLSISDFKVLINEIYALYTGCYNI